MRVSFLGEFLRKMIWDSFPFENLSVTMCDYVVHKKPRFVSKFWDIGAT